MITSIQFYHLRFLTLFVVLSLGIRQGNAQEVLFKTFSLADGLPQSQVYCALSDHHGYLWWGTQGGGLSRFDGLDFENFSSGDGLNSSYILSLHQSQDFKIWIGTNRGANVYKKGQFHPIKGVDFKVNTIGSSENGNRVWLGTKKGIYTIDQDTTIYLSIQGIGKQNINKIQYFDHTLFVATESSLWKVDSLNNAHLLINASVQDFSIRNDSLWIASYDQGIFVYDQKLIPVVSKIELPYCTSILKDRNNTLWVGTRDKGLFQVDLDSTNLNIVRSNNGLTHSHIKDLVLDHNGRLWVTSSGGGVACKSNRIFQHYSRNNGLRGKRIYAIHKDPLDTIWLSISKLGLQSYYDGVFTYWSLDTIIGDTKIKSICSDGLGRLWIGTEGRGVAMKDSLGWHLIDRGQGLPSDWIVEIVSDSDGNIWAASYSEGLFKINDNGDGLYSFHHFDQKKDLPDNRITTMSLDPRGNIWFGTAGGHVGNISPNNEVSTLSQVFSSAVRSIAFDNFNQLWIGTKGSGVWTVPLSNNSQKPIKLSDVQKTLSDNIYLVINDSLGNIWAGSERGVDHILLNEVGQVEKVIPYDQNDGFLGIETCHNSAYSENNGTIWFGTMNGLMQYFPGQYVQSCDTPIVHFESTKVFYEDILHTPFKDHLDHTGTLKTPVIMPHQQNHWSFKFKAIAQSSPENILYRYRLEGAEKEWSPATNSNDISYANLSPGSYRFGVMASVNDCDWTKPLYSNFRIEEPFWKSTWFILSIGFGISSLVLALIWFRIRSIRKKEAQKRAQLELENNLLQLEQKALQLQMNPHFIFNALTVIQSLIAGGKQKQARQQLNEFAHLMRGILYNSRKSEVSLEEEITLLQQYLSIARNCQAIPFNFSIKTDEGMDIENTFIPPMLLQPFVENAVVHGVSHLNYAGNIDICFALKDDLLKVIIEDNGIGREKAKALSVERSPGHQSVSMEVTIQRLVALMKTKNFSPIEIRDKSNAANHPGTIVEITIPVELKY